MPSEMLTFKEAGIKLRELAELTAKHSQNWENFESIASSIIEQAFNNGRNIEKEDK